MYKLFIFLALVSPWLSAMEHSEKPTKKVTFGAITIINYPKVKSVAFIEPTEEDKELWVKEKRSKQVELYAALEDVATLVEPINAPLATKMRSHAAVVRGYYSATHIAGLKTFCALIDRDQFACCSNRGDIFSGLDALTELIEERIAEKN